MRTKRNQRTKTAKTDKHNSGAGQLELALPGFASSVQPDGPVPVPPPAPSLPAPVSPEEAHRASVEPCEVRLSAPQRAEAVPVDRGLSSDGFHARSAPESPRSESSRQPAQAESWGRPRTSTKNSPQETRQLGEVGFGVPIVQLVELYDLLRGHVQSAEPEPHASGSSRRPEGDDSGRAG
jgi:hypothetical protein